ncbi:hypothetical protein ACFLZZ_02130 [Nanoarchaeota archaeon]
MYKLDNKGQLLGTTNALMAATVVIGVLIFVLSFYINIIGSSGDIASEITTKESLREQTRVSLFAYLSTPVEVENQTMLMSDLIQLVNIDRNYKEQLEKETENALKEVYGEWTSKNYGMEIIGPRDSGIATEGDFILRSSFNIKDAKWIVVENIGLPNDLDVKFTLITRKVEA